MSTNVSIADLKRMTPAELRKELNIKRAETAKMRLDLEMQSEKNHAAHRNGRRSIARMTMVLADMEKAEKKAASASVPTRAKTEAPAAKTASKTTKNAVKSPSSETKPAKSTAKKAKKS
jgi:ribosomal protein L29